MINFNSQPANEGMAHAIQFANAETGQEMLVKVFDKSPWMGDVHIEGRRYVEVSIEMFMALMQRVGWVPVQPASHNKTPALYDLEGMDDPDDAAEHDFKNADVDDDEKGVS